MFHRNPDHLFYRFFRLIICPGILTIFLIGCASPNPPISNGSTDQEPTVVNAQTATVVPISTPASGPSSDSKAATVVAKSPAEVTENLLQVTDVKARDLLALSLRLKGVNTLQTTPISPERESYKVGRRDTFWVGEQDGKQARRVNATLEVVTPHAYFYVEDGVTVNRTRLEQAARTFEEVIYPTNRKYFGNEKSPGIDNDEHITVLNLRASDYGGFFSVADTFPRTVNPFSNEREMIYISFSSFPPESSAYLTALAHEFQHMIAWNRGGRGETWIQEGMAVMASRLVGYPGIEEVQAFSTNPDTQLNAWSDKPNTVHRNYGAAFLFIDYLVQRYGNPDILATLLEEPEDGFEAIDSAFAKKGSSLKAQDLFKDWVIANYIDNPSLHDGRYGYRDVNIKAAIEKTIKVGHGREKGYVSQYAADYIAIEPTNQDFTIVFSGTETTSLIPDKPHSGRQFWWSNRGDNANTHLTKEFDLSMVKTATLSFWTWFDIEKGFDYAYIEASVDEGKTWQTLKGAHSTDANPTGNNLGTGYTGGGGGAGFSWIQEQIDLSSFAGKRILLRFEYVTDEAYNGSGFALDDISIPELGFSDEAEIENGWVADGFVRVYNEVPQRYHVQLITHGVETVVRDINLNEVNQGRLEIKSKDVSKGAILVVSGQAFHTLQKAEYEFSVWPEKQ